MHILEEGSQNHVKSCDNFDAPSTSSTYAICGNTHNVDEEPAKGQERHGREAEYSSVLQSVNTIVILCFVVYKIY